MEEVLPAAGEKVVADDDLRNLLPILNLGGTGPGVPAVSRQGGGR